MISPIPEIQNWFQSSRNKEAGAALLIRYSTSEFKKDCVASGNYTSEWLARELATLSKPVAEPALKHSELALTADDFENAPDEIRDLEKKWKGMYKEASFLHSRLAIVPEGRKDAAFRILELFKQIEPIWQMLNQYKASGKLPEVVQPKKTSIADSMKRVNNLKTYISKYKNTEARKDDVEKWMQEMQKLTEEINQ